MCYVFILGYENGYVVFDNNYPILEIPIDQEIIYEVYLSPPPSFVFACKAASLHLDRSNWSVVHRPETLERDQSVKITLGGIQSNVFLEATVWQVSDTDS